YDQHPRFPKLTGFLDFWSGNLDGRLYKVTVAHTKLVKPAELRFVDGDFRLH
ncbi:MAG TPA: protein usg, partial [Hyphomicrobiaceae bacterium]|nr:protein usg [Hyphomicrobiaceae bacterium]